jgi:hypothetical protein
LSFVVADRVLAHTGLRCHLADLHK